jgi:translation initiation factor 1
MAPDREPRLVYSTRWGRVCPECGSPLADCTCSCGPDEPVPRKATAKLRLERKGRGGKSVTVVDGLPKNKAFLDRLARELKRTCGVGGRAGDGSIELQGDQREKLRALLPDRGFVVKG